ncbi:MULTISPECIES: acyltransferase [Pectobacterium]|uniref:acyltransferase n=1 Tax=Pectobacterium TaxID=122277 RepID=UPI0005835709|nr:MULTISPECIES: acyltransferase [Pectobacterium]KHS85090.1 acetyltransferase [Pectobacterium carotovorum subsp. carotovorum]MDE8742020.1 acyltransferase [Pectobacterium polaris]
MLKIINRIKFYLLSPRLGPDMFLTHILLHSNFFSKILCEKKFKTFGEKSYFRPGAYAIETKKIEIGNNVVIRPGTMLFASPLGEDTTNIEIHDNVLIGSGVHVYVSNHEYRKIDVDIIFQGHQEVKKVVIEQGCWIGANAILLPGVTIGKGSVVGAGSIVTKSVPPHTVVVGNPAKIIKILSD